MIENQGFYDLLANKILRLVNYCQLDLTNNEIMGIKKNLSVGEYGLAFQDLCYTLKNNDISLSDVMIDLVDSLFEQMGMKEKDDVDNWLWIEMSSYLGKQKKDKMNEST